MTTSATSLSSASDGLTTDNETQKPNALVGLLKLAGKRTTLLLFACLCGIGTALFAFGPAFAIAGIADVILNEGPRSVWFYAAFAAATLLIRWILLASGMIATHVAAYQVLYDLRIEIANRLARMPLGFITNQSSGRIQRILGDDVERIELFVAHMIIDAVIALTTMVGSIALLLWVDWRMALAMLFMFPIAFSMQLFMYKDSDSMMREYVEAGEKMNVALVQFVQGISVIKAFGLTAESFDQLQKSVSDYHDLYKGFIEITIPSWAGFQVIVKSSLIVMLPIGGWLVLEGLIGLPALLLSFLIGLSALTPLLKLMRVSGSLRIIEHGLTRINTVLEAPDLEEKPTTARPTDHALSFDQVTFSYETETGHNLAIRDVSFAVPAGSMTALVGPSGAGKSTIAHLLARFWDIDQGTISIGGVNIKDMSLDALNEQISFVFQDVFLFRDTVKDNIRIARPDASDSDIISAAKTAQAHDFIMELPNGYDTLIGERGGGLSGGERQRLSIARAILKNAPIIVLDEATAFADPISEAAINQALSNLVTGKTTLIIAHRLSAIANADQIVVMDEGMINARGKHAELLKDNSLYQRLWNKYRAARGWRMGQHAPQGDTQESRQHGENLKKEAQL